MVTELVKKIVEKKLNEFYIPNNFSNELLLKLLNVYGENDQRLYNHVFDLGFKPLDYNSIHYKKWIEYKLFLTF